MRKGRLGIAAAVILLAGPAWAGPAETCLNAGYRAGTAAFDMCVGRLTTDDPLAELSLDVLDMRGKAALAPVGVPQRDDQLPASTSPPGPAPAPPPTASSASSGMTQPTAPRPPSPPSFSITMPTWNWSD